MPRRRERASGQSLAGSGDVFGIPPVLVATLTVGAMLLRFAVQHRRRALAAVGLTVGAMLLASVAAIAIAQTIFDGSLFASAASASACD